MKNIIKKINVLAIVAMLIGGGFAFATINDDPTPTIYFDQEEGWLPLDGMVEGVDYKCVGETSECTASLNPETGNPENIKPGTFSHR